MRYGRWDAGHIMKNGVTVYDSRIKRKPTRFEPIFIGRIVPPTKAGKKLKSPVFAPSRSKTTAHHS